MERLPSRRAHRRAHARRGGTVQGGECRLDLRVLGGFEVIADGRPVDIGGPQLRIIMARLIVDAGRTVGVGALAEELWSGQPPIDAYRTVRTYVSRLRVALRRA